MLIILIMKFRFKYSLLLLFYNSYSKILCDAVFGYTDLKLPPYI